MSRGVLVSTRGGYASPRYAQQFEGRYLLRKLPGYDYPLLTFPLPHYKSVDLRTPYPLCSSEKFPELIDALKQQDDVVTLTAILDPFFLPSTDLLDELFDVVRPYKQSYLVDYSCYDESQIRRNHRINLSKAMDHVLVEELFQPESYAEEFHGLYRQLIRKYSISGPAAFTVSEIRCQLKLPGTRYFRAINCETGRPCSALICFQDGAVVYAHLAASSSDGYRLKAPFALFWYAINSFKSLARWFYLGGAPDQGHSGLEFFKSGWANALTSTYLCGAVSQPRVYQSLVDTMIVKSESRPVIPTYFPLYRDRLGWPSITELNSEHR